MTGPTPPTPVKPNLGRYGSFGIGRQIVPGTAVAPEQFLRWSGGTPLTPTVVVTDDNFANASVFPMQGRQQGRTYQGKNVNFEVDHASLVLLLQLVMGASLVAGTGGAPSTITPSGLNYDTNMPLRPCTIEANMPGSPTRVTDAQFHNLQLTMNARANFTGQAGFMAVSADDMADPATAVIPTANIYQYKNHFIEWNAGAVQPESSTFTLDAGIAAVDAARGNQAAASDNILGFERNGLLTLSGQFSVAGVPPAMLAAYRSQATFALNWILRKYAPDGTTVLKEVKLAIPAAQLSLVEPPTGLERIVTPVSWKAVSLGGEVPFTARVIN